MSRLVCTRRSYRLDITNAQMLALLDSESFTKPDPVGGSLFDKLDKMTGVSRVEYNGHFGSAIYFELDADIDTADFRAGVKGLILTHLDNLPRKAKKCPTS